MYAYEIVSSWKRSLYNSDDDDDVQKIDSKGGREKKRRC
jgi:hypothetical protein